MGGLTLRQGRPGGAALARWAFLTSAVMLTIELSAGLTPTNTFPGHRPPIIAGYWAYAVVGIWLSVRGTDAGRSGR
jgi:hypothetical protein